MTEKKQPEALRLAGLLELAPEDGVEPQTTEDASAELRRLHAENESLRAERERNLHSIRINNKKLDENETLRTGYAAARLEIESLRARGAPPDVSGYVSEWSGGLCTSDEAMDGIAKLYAAQPAGAQQPGTAYAAAGDSEPSNSELRKKWRDAGGAFHGPNVETGTMPEDKLLPFLRSLASHGQAPAQDANEYLDLLAQCRSAFPIPERGDPLEVHWAAAMADPGEVPGYLQEIAARHAAQAAPAAVAGPSEPTSSMYRAAQMILLPTGDDDGGSIMLNTSQVRALWQAMLAAAPTTQPDGDINQSYKERYMEVWFRPPRMHGHPESTPIKATITKDRGNGIVDLTYDDGVLSGNARAVPNALRLPRNVREQVAVWWDDGFEMDFQTAVNNSLSKKKDDQHPQPAPQQEPVAFIHWPINDPPRLVWYSQKALNDAILKTYEGHQPDVKLYTAPQPSPASQGDALSQAARDVLAERQRQIRAEGWTQSHDDLEHEPGQLSSAAACYTLNASAWLKHPYASRADYANLSPINWSNWPWDEKWWKPKNERRDLVRAGALILAELERIDRADAARAAQEGK